ncbi:copper chaperone PCu(A)C [Alteromonas gilva]|uniref:Copper chaperone PCu(A)C n=1 Tax=Alteromonas gilva TaxID=2987522 RepID=A0ABT5L6Y6_9ALTE|nr:copper chaperone PCu(A)C [Alteromonas gilva]MDC8832179.1 copper chaperone PCu(A)C [Alteromonas gilva]
MSVKSAVITLVLATHLFWAAPAVLAMDSIMVHNANARATFALASTAAVYLTVMNHHDSPIVLEGVSVSSDIAAEAQIHTTFMEGDMMKMRQVTDGIGIAPDAMVELKPGSYHIMLMGLVKPLETGNTFNLTLHFDNQADKTVLVTVGDAAKAGTHLHH